MQDQTTLSDDRMSRPQGLAAMRDTALLGICNIVLRNRLKGRIRLTLPSGVTRTIGRDGGADGRLKLNNFRLVWSGIRRGTLGFAEAVLDDHAETPDLAELFRFFIDNKRELDTAGGGFFRVRRSDRDFHAERRNSRDGSRRNIAAHYDLGNDFYAAWLDPGFTYSSARFTRPDLDLAAAQDEKVREVVDALGVRAGHRVLEIGCGWGGFAEAACRAGASVHGITVSENQLAFATDRMSRAGLADRAKIVFEDYRDTVGEFDRIASIEMIEAVGEEHWDDYFATLRNRLVPGGLAVIQAITIREQSFPAYRAKADFIQRYIFPGGMLPTKSAMAACAQRHGLDFETVRTFAPDYARTLSLWRERFHANWPRIAALGFDDRFRRMWDYYLVYCEVGFQRGVIDVGHYRLTKPAGLAS
jgi:cyclopropane-fatty-acyl-phospholipid synthase